MAVHNLTDRPVTVKLEKPFEHLIEYFGDQPYEAINGESMELNIGPFGYRWFRKSSLFL